MKDKYIIWAAIYLSVIVAASVFTINTEQKDIYDNKKNRKNRLSAFFLSLTCVVCILGQGFMIGEIYSISTETYNSQIMPLSIDIFDGFRGESYPNVRTNAQISLKTTESGLFSIVENTLFIPKDINSAIIIAFPEKIEDFKADFKKCTSCFVLEGREYVFINKTVSYLTKNIVPTVWKDGESNISKLYTAIPLSKTEELMIYTDISGINSTEEIEKISSYLKKIAEKVEFIENIAFKINGFDINESNLAYITSNTITLDDGSFVSSSFFYENQRTSLKSIYSDKVFESWQTSSKISADSEGRRAYVRVVDGVRYNLFSTEDNFEVARKTFDFDVLLNMSYTE